MKEQIEQVKDFRKRFEFPIGTPIGEEPTVDQSLCGKLLLEEAKETDEAIRRGDLVEIADGVMDVLYVAFGTALTYGFHDKVKELFDAVHDSNMSKLGEDGKPVKREDGKTLKGPNYHKPTEDIKRILNVP
jgi:predicted HAD superfamily Cof-like phosphohydrolase